MKNRVKFLSFPVTFLLLTAIFYFSYSGSAISKITCKEYGIALLLPDNYVTEAQRLSDQISRKLFQRNLDNHFHITLYQGCFAEDQIREIFKKLSDQKFAAPGIKMSSDIEFQDKKYINWNVLENEKLKDLHSKVVITAAPYHQGILKRLADNNQKFDSKTQKQIDQYGVNGVLENYKPHVTLFYLPATNLEAKDLINENFIKDLTPTSTSTSNETAANNLVIGEIGYDGNLVNIIDKIVLD